MRNKAIFKFFKISLSFTLMMMSSRVLSGSNGVEFREAELSLKKDTLKLFNERFRTNRYDKKTGILYLTFDAPIASKKNVGLIEIGLLDGEIISKKIDSNGDGFSNITKIIRPRAGVEFEESHDRNFDKSYDLVVTRTYKKESLLTEIVSKIDSNFDGTFDKTSQRLGVARQPMLVNGAAKVCFEREVFTLDGELGQQIFAIAESYGLNYTSSTLDQTQARVRVEIERSCDESTEELFTDGTTFDSLMDEALNEGLNCLRSPKLSDHYQFDGPTDRRDDPMSVAGVVYLNSVSMLLGQQIFENPLGANGADAQGYPVRNNDRNFRNLTVMCSESRSSFQAASNQSGGWLEGLRGGASSGEALGLGSTGLSSPRKQVKCESGNLTVEHPYISLNMARFNATMTNHSNTDKRMELKRLIFHEYLHTTGMEHESHFDPVTSCSICCFPYGDRELVRLACNSCRGESALGLNQSALERQVDLQAPLYEMMGVSGAHYRNALQDLEGRVPASSIQRLQERLD